MKALILLLALSGCSSIKGVHITEQERQACEISGCSVWTEGELEGMARRFYRQGYTAGVRSI